MKERYNGKEIDAAVCEGYNADPRNGAYVKREAFTFSDNSRLSLLTRTEIRFDDGLSAAGGDNPLIKHITGVAQFPRDTAFSAYASGGERAGDALHIEARITPSGAEFSLYLPDGGADSITIYADNMPVLNIDARALPPGRGRAAISIAV